MKHLEGAHVILWCNLCQSREADGKLEVIFEGEVESTVIDACEQCVEGIEADRWLGNTLHSTK